MQKQNVIGEDIIRNWCQTSGISAVIFRFSNPIGANERFMFGDHGKKGFENLLPYIVRCAVEEKPMVFRGNNHTTKDGTPIRDYIGVVDLANIVSIVLMSDQAEQCEVLNVGRGSGFSLLEIVGAVEEVLGKKIDYSFSEKSDLEASVSILDVSKLKERYNVVVKQNLKEIVESQIRFFEHIRQK